MVGPKPGRVRPNDNLLLPGEHDMASYNKVIMVGNLTRDPQLSYLPSNTPVVEFGLASNRRWKDQSGQQREDVCFIDCRAYGRSAEILNQYTSKGRQILIEGRLQFDTWEGKDGTRRSKHRIFVENFQFLDSGRAQGQGGQGQAARADQQAPAPQRQPRQAPQAPQQAPPQAPQQAPPQAPQQAPPQAPQQAPQQTPPQAFPDVDEPPSSYNANDGGDDIPF